MFYISHKIERYHQFQKMSSKDFQGIKKFKILIALIVLSIMVGSVYSFFFHQDNFIKVIISVQGFLLIKEAYYVILTSLATYQSFRVLRRVQKKEKYCLHNNPNLLHAIMLPIYKQSITILKKTLNQLKSHQKAKSNYLIFLALEDHSERPRERAQKLLQIFEDSFKLMDYTIHELKPGQARGKHSNENCCLQSMEQIFLQRSIDPAKVIFTTIDCDNQMPETYFQEVEYFLSRHNWKTSKYMFAPQQMYTMNNEETPIINRHADYGLASGVYVWSNTLTKVQHAVSNFSLDYLTFKSQGFFDTNADAMCDDMHQSLKSVWKNEAEDFEIVPIYTMVDMVSLQTGKCYLSDISARFWQAERHMMAMLEVAYLLNMLTKNPFRFRAFWVSITFIETHFVIMGCLMPLFINLILTVATGRIMTPQEDLMIKTQTVLYTILTLQYFIVMKRSAKVLYQQKKQISWRIFLEQVLINKIILLFFCVIPQFFATMKLAVKVPCFHTCEKITTEKKKQKNQ